MKRTSAALFIYFLYCFLLSAQNVWYFGNGAGLDFSTGNARPLFDGKIFTLEGCASACDEKGKLLFYTDGITVWNRHHNIMENGTGLNGSQSSTQAALVVPQPGPKGNYFVFVMDEKAGKKGLTYSLIDISSGEGVVVKKNILILTSSSEKLSVVKQGNGKGYWVIAHQWKTSNFYVFPITAQGIGQPVYSCVGLPHAETGAGENREAIGCMAASSDGKKIALVTCYRAKNNLELFDFNEATGKLSNAVAVTLSGSPYGVCFSPDNTKLYVSFLKGKSGIIQYDMNDGSVIEVVAGNKDNSFGTLRLGPDGKLYVARAEEFLDIIVNPDGKAGACRYVSRAVDLSPASSNFGLPNTFLPLSSLSSDHSLSSASAAPSLGFDCAQIVEKPFSAKKQLVMSDIAVCEDEYILSAKNFGASYNWSTLETTQRIVVKVSGLYRVAITRQGCTVLDSVRIRFRKETAVFRFLPAFNPETEFMNGEFYYEIDDIQSFEMKIYDPKGRKVLFETTNSKKTWNGKNQKGNIVPAGEYPWTVKYKPNCPKESKLVTQEGKVTVKRTKD